MASYHSYAAVACLNLAQKARERGDKEDEEYWLDRAGPYAVEHFKQQQRNRKEHNGNAH